MSAEGEGSGVGATIGAVAGLSALSVGVGVIAPAVVASGYGTEGGAVAGGIIFLYWVYRMFFGKEVADDMMKDEKEKAKERAGQR